jgi:hypothetical protein
MKILDYKCINLATIVHSSTKSELTEQLNQRGEQFPSVGRYEVYSETSTTSINVLNTLFLGYYYDY